MELCCFFVVASYICNASNLFVQKKQSEEAVAELRSRVDALLGEVAAAQKERKCAMRDLEVAKNRQQVKIRKKLKNNDI